MGSMASQITSLTIVYLAVYSGADQRKHQRNATLAFVWGIHRLPVNSPRKGPTTRKMFPFVDVIMRRYKRDVQCLSYNYGAGSVLFCYSMLTSKVSIETWIANLAIFIRVIHWHRNNLFLVLVNLSLGYLDDLSLSRCWYPWPLLLTWFHFNPSMDK